MFERLPEEKKRTFCLKSFSSIQRGKKSKDEVKLFANQYTQQCFVHVENPMTKSILPFPP